MQKKPRRRDRITSVLSRISIRNRLILIYALILVLFFTVSSLFFVRVREHYTENLKRQTSDLLYMVSHYLSVSMEELETETYHLVTDQTLQTELREYLDAGQLSRQVSLWSSMNDLILKYAGNSTYISSVTLASRNAVTTRGRTSYTEDGEYMQTVLRKADAGAGAPVWMPSASLPETVLLARCVREIRNMSLATMGEIVYRIRLDKIAADLLSRHEFLSRDTPLVISEPSDGKILYPSEGTAKRLYQAASQVEEGSFERIVDGPVSYLVFSEGLPSGWRCSLLVSYDELTAPIRWITLLILVVMACVTVGMFAGASAFAVAFTKHFSVLQEKMKRVEENLLEPMETETDYGLRSDEIGYLHQAFDRMVSKLRQLIEENYTNQLLLRDAQIHSLVQQMNPHFLYNTLDLIYWDAKMAGQDNICAVTDALGSLLRASVQKHAETDSLKEEMELADSYMEIQQQRFGKRLIYEKEINETLLSVATPFMCLQPLLENAMRYGVENMAGPCTVRVKAVREDGMMLLSVMNEGSSFPEDLLQSLRDGSLQPQSNGIALVNIDTRIRLLFGDAYGLSFINARNIHHEETAEAVIRLPLRR